MKPMFVVLCTLLAVSPICGQGKPPKPSGNIPVTVILRCPGTGCIPTDGIGGDFYGPYANDVTRFFLNTAGGHGALWLYVDPPRSFRLDFTQPDGIAPCELTMAGCNKNFTIIDTPSPSPATAVNPTDEYDVELPQGFLGIPIGGSAYARVKINFPDPLGRNLLWTIRFNSSAYPGTTNVAVRRISESTWEVEATAEDRARLVCVTTRGRPAGTDEGLYIMPFKMTVVK